MTHPDDATLQTWHDRALPAADDVAVDEHLARCADCSSRAEGLRALGDAFGAWADDAPVDFDVTASVLAKVSAEARANDASSAAAPASPGPVKVVPLDAARARRSPGRAVLYPAFAAVAALVFFLVWHNPSGVQFHKVPAPAPDPVVQVGGGPGGAEVTQVDVQGAQSYSVLQIQGVSPGAMTAVVWIQDPPEESTTPSTTH